LRVKPDQSPALQVLAHAQFAQADFSAAAESYRRVLGLNPSHLEFSGDYARALAAADRKTAAAEFRLWADSTGWQENFVLKAPLAGLSLLAGDADLARSITQEATQDYTQEWAPGALLDLGWWYYLAGDYPSALSLVGNAVQQRPGNAAYTTKQGWVQIEQRTLADALQSLEPGYEQGEDAERQMARAVALWRAQRQDEAMISFESASGKRPEWENPRWVRALYSPGVAETVRQMKAERERRSKIGVKKR
jgi:tetratricopeptide (TPR) repeat protein